MAEDAQRHIAIFYQSLLGGGTQRNILNLVNGLLKEGVKVDLLLSEAKGIFLDDVPKGVEVIDLMIQKSDSFSIFGLRSGLQSVRSLPGLIRYLRRARPDALLTVAHFSNEIAVLAKGLARVKTKVIVSEHNTLSVNARRAKAGLVDRFSPLFARIFYPWADCIVAISRGVAVDLSKNTGIRQERIKTIYVPAVTSDITEKSREEIGHPWFRDSGVPVIMGSGRLTDQKDFYTLIRAFAKVRESKAVRLIILGEGAEKENLLRLAESLGAEKDLEIIPFVKNPFAYMAKASVFVLSSAWEGFGNVIAEALAVGTPVVSTDCPSGPSEILDNGRYGYLVPVGDYNSMADAILEVLSGNAKTVDPAWLTQFSAETVSKKYKDLL